MLRHPTHPGRLRTMRHRIVAIAVLVLQVAVAASALWEPGAEMRLDTHAERNGARHVDLHNEATCLLCSARAQTSLPSLPEPTLDSPRQAAAASPLSYDAPSVADHAPRRSRAPPSLTA